MRPAVWTLLVLVGLAGCAGDGSPYGQQRQASTHQETWLRLDWTQLATPPGLEDFPAAGTSGVFGTPVHVVTATDHYTYDQSDTGSRVGAGPYGGGSYFGAVLIKHPNGEVYLRGGVRDGTLADVGWNQSNPISWSQVSAGGLSAGWGRTPARTTCNPLPCTYAIGGSTALSPPQAVPEVWSFDLETQAWTERAQTGGFPSRYLPVVVENTPNMLIIGGRTTGNDMGPIDVWWSGLGSLGNWNNECLTLLDADQQPVAVDLVVAGGRRSLNEIKLLAARTNGSFEPVGFDCELLTQPVEPSCPDWELRCVQVEAEQGREPTTPVKATAVYTPWNSMLTAGGHVTGATGTPTPEVWEYRFIEVTAVLTVDAVIVAGQPAEVALRVFELEAGVQSISAGQNASCGNLGGGVIQTDVDGYARWTDVLFDLADTACTIPFVDRAGRNRSVTVQLSVTSPDGGTPDAGTPAEDGGADPSDGGNAGEDGGNGSDGGRPPRPSDGGSADGGDIEDARTTLYGCGHAGRGAVGLMLVLFAAAVARRRRGSPRAG